MKKRKAPCEARECQMRRDAELYANIAKYISEMEQDDVIGLQDSLDLINYEEFPALLGHLKPTDWEATEVPLRDALMHHIRVCCEVWWDEKLLYKVEKLQNEIRKCNKGRDKRNGKRDNGSVYHKLLLLLILCNLFLLFGNLLQLLVAIFLR